MEFPPLIAVTGMILSIIPFGRQCCSHLVSLQTDSGVVNFVVSQETYVVDTARLRPGMRITGYYDADQAVPLIYPPQYRAVIIVPRSPQEEVLLQYFDENLLSEDGSLQLNLSPRTIRTTPNGQPFACQDPGGNTLIVYYRETTRSIPPQTTPRKIIVLC